LERKSLQAFQYSGLLAVLEIVPLLRLESRATKLTQLNCRKRPSQASNFAKVKDGRKQNIRELGGQNQAAEEGRPGAPTRIGDSGTRLRLWLTCGRTPWWALPKPPPRTPLGVRRGAISPGREPGKCPHAARLNMRRKRINRLIRRLNIVHLPRATIVC
jgi:hypothetical protein